MFLLPHWVYLLINALTPDQASGMMGAMPKRLSTGPAEEKLSRSLISRVMTKMGKKGGKIGGKRRLVTLTPERRKAIAQKAANTRWHRGED